MRRPRHRRSRWTAGAEALLLGCLSAPGAWAAGAAGETPVVNGSAPGSIVALGGTGAQSMAGLTDLYLETTINGADRGLTHFGERGGELWATPDVLRQLGFRLPADGTDPVHIASLPGVQVDFDPLQQSVRITAPLAMLNLATTRINTREMSTPNASTSAGALLNYNLFGTHDSSGNNSLSAFTELRAFNSLGVLSSTQLTQTTRTGDVSSSRSVRLDTSWSQSFPSQMLTIRAGDTLTAATEWSRATRIGGIQIGTNFGLQPYQVTTPLPQFFGSAVLPSQVQLFINGMQQYSGQMPAGPFDLTTVPGINGAGNAQVVMTDALGRVTTLNFSLYNATRLLRAGLSDWSAEFGFVRQNYGLASFDYAKQPMASGSWRHGFNDHFTGAVHAEATAGVANLGAGGNWLIGSAGGVLSGSLARSRASGLGGSQFGLGYQWSNSRFNFGVSALRATSGYRDVAAVDTNALPPALTISAQAGISTATLGSFGLGYARLDYQGQTNRFVSAYWSRPLGHGASINLNINQNLERPRDRSIFLTLSIAFGSRDFASASVQHQGGSNIASVDVTRSIPQEGGLGWRAQTQQGSGMHNGQAELDYLGRYGYLQAGATHFGGVNGAYAGATGALVWMAGRPFASRQIDNSFALVSTDGVPNVPVKLENNPVGTTDAHGQLLVTPLNAYQNNKLSIDPMTLPADVRIGRIDREAVPSDRAGVVVDFDITPVRAATIILHDAAGQPLPLGSSATLRGQRGTPALVGYGGETYMDTLQAHNVLDVTTPSVKCEAVFDYRSEGNTIPRIGPLTCTKEVSQ